MSIHKLLNLNILRLMIIYLTEDESVSIKMGPGVPHRAANQMEGKKDMEELRNTLEGICLEHLVMRRMLREDRQLARVRELCQLDSFRDAVRTQFDATFGTNLGHRTNVIAPVQLLAALSTTNLAD